MLHRLGCGIRQLAREFGVDKRTIQFIIFPERKAKNYQDRLDRGGSKIYYDREKHTNAMRDHRQYKQKLFKEGAIK